MFIEKFVVRIKDARQHSGKGPASSSLCISADEGGVEIVEFIGIMPLMLAIGLLVWQAMVFLHVPMHTTYAAREGARTAAAYEDAYGAVSRVVGGSYDYRVSAGSCAPGSPVRVRVRLRVPMIEIPYIGRLTQIWTDSTATMRCEPPWK
jgi:hypothetical protein